MEYKQQQQPPGVEIHQKVKFTVTVCGRKWSSARLQTETLKDFILTVQNNARRLEYISPDDTIQRLQLANGDGSEPEDLDVDASLGDVMICMGRKHLLAVVKFTTPTHSSPPPSATAACQALTAGHGQESSMSAILAQCSSHYSGVKAEQAGVDHRRHSHVVGTGAAMAGRDSSADFGWSPSWPVPPVPTEDPHVVTYFPLDPQARGHQSPCPARGHQLPCQDAPGNAVATGDVVVDNGLPEGGDHLAHFIKEVRSFKEVVAGMEYFLLDDDHVTLGERHRLLEGLKEMQEELALRLAHGNKHSSEVRAKWRLWLSGRGWHSNDQNYETGLGLEEAEPDA